MNIFNATAGIIAKKHLLTKKQNKEKNIFISNQNDIKRIYV